MQFRYLLVPMCFFLLSCESAMLCGRYSDDCSTQKGEDIDYVFYSNLDGKLWKIEMQNVQPADETCGENHLHGLIWKYIVHNDMPGEYSYNVSGVDVSFVSYDLKSSLDINCTSPIESGKPISLLTNKCYDKNGRQLWDDFPSYLGGPYTFTFTPSEGHIQFGRTVYTYVNSDGCPLGINNTWLTILIGKSIKTIAGDKVKLYKQSKKDIHITKRASDKKNTPVTTTKDKSKTKNETSKKTIHV
ncbi:hypothetical protein WA158_000074 [Blastocystis sp. Blastoise]